MTATKSRRTCCAECGTFAAATASGIGKHKTPDGVACKNRTRTLYRREHPPADAVMHAARYNARAEDELTPMERGEWVHVDLPLGKLQIRTRGHSVTIRCVSDYGRLTIRPEVANEVVVSLEDYRIDATAPAPQ